MILEALSVLVLGMLGIFVVMSLIFITIFLLNKVFDRQHGSKE